MHGPGLYGPNDPQEVPVPMGPDNDLLSSALFHENKYSYS